MIVEPDEKELKAVWNLMNSKEGEIFLSYLDKALNAERVSGDTLKVVFDIHWNQGRRQAIAGIIDICRNARTTLEDIERAKNERIPQL